MGSLLYHISSSRWVWACSDKTRGGGQSGHPLLIQLTVNAICPLRQRELVFSAYHNRLKSSACRSMCWYHHSPIMIDIIVIWRLREHELDFYQWLYETKSLVMKVTVWLIVDCDWCQYNSSPSGGLVGGYSNHNKKHNLASVGAQNLYFLQNPSELLVFVWVSLRVILSLTKFEVIKRLPWLLVTDYSNPINLMSHKVIHIVKSFCIFRKSLPMHLRSTMTADGTPLWRPHKLMSHCCFKLMTVMNSGDYFNYWLCDK